MLISLEIWLVLPCRWARRLAHWLTHTEAMDRERVPRYPGA